MMRISLDHLPEPIRRELRTATDILFAAFAEALRGKQAPHRKAGRILKLILFGAFSRSDWREIDSGAGVTAFDILVIVNHDELVDEESYWHFAIDRLDQAWKSGTLRRPVRITAQSLGMINSMLDEGVPFFVRIVEDGIALYQVSPRPLATPHHLAVEDRRIRAAQAYRIWFPKAGDFLAGALFFRDRGNGGMAALLLHQACEQLYRCVLSCLTLHDRRTHSLHDLRDLAEQQDGGLRDAWPRATRFERRAFARIRRAYVEARYSGFYRISDDELAWAAERVERLHLLVDRACRRHLSAMGGAPQALVATAAVSPGGDEEISNEPRRLPRPILPLSPEPVRVNRLVRKWMIPKFLVNALPILLALLVVAFLAVLISRPVARADASENGTEHILTIQVEAPTTDDGPPDRRAADREPLAPSDAVDFDVPASPLVKAVETAARQAGYEIVSDATIWDGRSSAGLRVHGTIGEALTKLLYGSGLCASIVEGAVIVRRCGASESAGPSPAST